MAPFIAALEDSPSGLWRTLGKRVGFTPSRVRISYPPPAGIFGFPKIPFCRLEGRDCNIFGDTSKIAPAPSSFFLTRYLE